MMIIRTILFSIIFSCLPFVVINAFFNKDLHVLTMKEGLSDNTVTSICKDKDGFMWFGTNNGISRYDGKVIKKFIVGSDYMYVSSIVEISKECLGIISNDRLYVFNRRTESFIPLSLGAGDTELHTTHLLSVGDGKFWAIWGNELTLYRVAKKVDDNGCVVSLNIDIENKQNHILQPRQRCAAICYTSDQSGIYLITRDGQLLLFDCRKMKIRQSLRLLNYKQTPMINSIVEIGGFLWISTVGKGIIRYNLKSAKVDYLTYQEQKRQNKLSHTDVFQVIQVSNNRLLAATWNGYTLITPSKHDSEELTTEIYNNAAFINRNLETRMISAYFDPDGVLWIGTNGGGVMFSDLRLQYFEQYHQDRHNEICGITADKDHYIWLATFHKGIMKSDIPFTPNGRLSFSEVGIPEVRAKQTVLCVLKDKNGKMWFGNQDGTLTCYDETNSSFSVNSLHGTDGTLNCSPIWATYIDSKNRFWIGTEDGLLQYDSKQKTFRRIPIAKKLKTKLRLYIRAIAESKDGTIWLGTSELGVCKLKINENGDFTATVGYEAKSKISLSPIRSLLASTDGNLYIGYVDGLAVLSPVKDRIEHCYTTRDGMCSNFVGCIVEDRKGHIWIGNNSGMSRYSRHRNLFYNYYIAGSCRSAYLCDETLFWGNNKSLTFFNPNAMDQSQMDNKVVLTSLNVSGNQVDIGVPVNGQTILRKSISFTDSIVLSYANKDFSLMFNNLSYSEEQQIYNYRLLPYQKVWQVSNDGEKASYTNLPEGEYSFEVRSLFPDGKQGGITAIHITILPHWSNSGLFRFFLLLAFAGIAFYLIRMYRIKRRRVEHEMQMKQELLTLNLEREKEKQIRTERENFFTGAAHELRTPLTLILAPLQEMMRQASPTETFYKKLCTMHKNSMILHTLVDRFLYVQKIEAGMVKLQLSEVDMLELVDEVADSFRQMAEVKNYSFEVVLPEAPIMLWVDVEKMSSAVRNLLSNAFKYTSPGGKISVSIIRTVVDEKDFCLIKIKDTGVGIPKELHERIFDSFITGDTNPNISSKVGLGLRIVKNTLHLHHGQVTLESTLGEGSCFTLHIPEGKAHFVDDTYQTVAYNKDRKVETTDVVMETPVIKQEPDVVISKRKILVIEDNVSVREYICSLFASRFNMIEAENGEEGVRLAMEYIPDLIISDVMMPVKDGFTCCREIRTHFEIAHIPILMLTAKAEDADMLQGTNCGADDYMMKPFNPQLLVAKVENLILQRERLKRIYTKALMIKNEPPSDEKTNPFMEQLVYAIETNMSDADFNVKSLAEQLNMSQPTLYRKMKQHTELNVVDIIRNVRVSKAASLIMENYYSIQQISEMVGFNDVRTFRKHFTEQFGVSPSKYAGQNIDEAKL